MDYIFKAYDSYDELKKGLKTTFYWLIIYSIFNIFSSFTCNIFSIIDSAMMMSLALLIYLKPSRIVGVLLFIYSLANLYGLIFIVHNFSIIHFIAIALFIRGAIATFELTKFDKEYIPLDIKNNFLSNPFTLLFSIITIWVLFIGSIILYSFGDMSPKDPRSFQEKISISNIYYSLGRMNDPIEGITKNPIRAIELYTKAAEDNHLYAIHRLGKIYEGRLDGGNLTTEGTYNWYIAKPLINYQLAKKWYEKGDELGYGYSQNNLGLMYMDGSGVDKNLKKAIKLFKKSGNNAAINNIGVIYRDEYKDPYKAIEYFEQSASNGYLLASRNLAQTYEELNHYDKALTAYIDAATKGDEFSQHSACKIYRDGLGGKHNLDINKAKYWLEMAANNGCLEASSELNALNGYN